MWIHVDVRETVGQILMKLCGHHKFIVLQDVFDSHAASCFSAFAFLPPYSSECRQQIPPLSITGFFCQVVVAAAANNTPRNFLSQNNVVS